MLVGKTKGSAHCARLPSKRERERQTDRQTDRGGERQTEGERERETDRQRERGRERQRGTDRQTDRATKRGRDREREVHIWRGREGGCPSVKHMCTPRTQVHKYTRAHSPQSCL